MAGYPHQKVERKVRIKGTHIEHRKLGKGWSFLATVRRENFPTVSAPSKTLEEAEAWIQTILADQRAMERAARQAMDPPSTGEPQMQDLLALRLDDVLDKFKETSDCAPRNRSLISKTKELALCPTLGELKPAWIKGFINRVRKMNSNRGTPYSLDTISNHLSVIGVAMKWRAEEMNLNPPGFIIKEVYWENVCRAEGRDGKDGAWRSQRTRRFEEGEEKALFAHLLQMEEANREHWELLARFALETCARQKEMRLANWSEISALITWWNIPKHKTKAREMKLTDEAKRILVRLYEIRDPQNPLIFHGLGCSKHISRRFNELIKEAGLKDFRFHDLRHEGITRFVASQSAETEQLMKMVGHSSLKMLRLYTHLRKAEVERMMAKGGMGGFEVAVALAKAQREAATGSAPSTSVAPAPSLLASGSPVAPWPITAPAPAAPAAAYQTAELRWMPLLWNVGKVAGATTVEWASA